MTADLFDNTRYNQILEELLDRLRDEVALLAKVGETADNPDLDQYLLDVNTYYYQSFHQQFIPQYLHSIQEEITRLMRISQQQDTLAANIMSTLKRYARLHNLLKSITLQMEAGAHRQSAEQVLYTSERYRQGVELGLTVMGLEISMQTLIRWLETARQWMMDQELMNYWREYPGFVSALLMMEEYSDDAAMAWHAMDRIQSELGYILFALQQTPGESRELRSDIWQHLDLLKNEHDPEAIKIFVGQKLLPELQVYMTAAETCQVSGVPVKEMVIQRIKGWQKVLQAGRDCQVGHQPLGLHVLPHLHHIQLTDLEELLRDVESSAQSLHATAAGLRAGEQDLAQDHLKQVREWLDFTIGFFRSISKEQEIKRVPELWGHVHQVRLGLSFLSNQVSMMETSWQRNTLYRDQASRTEIMLEDYRLHVSGVLSDLERLLAPRNVSRTWKDMGVHLERISMLPGELFPSEHLQLLNRFRVETDIREDVPENTILQAEGDIFIIQVMDAEEIEMPYLRVSLQP